jgi:hypothetical protein
MTAARPQAPAGAGTSATRLELRMPDHHPLYTEAQAVAEAARCL